MLIEEASFSHIFKHPAISKQQLIPQVKINTLILSQECDNDYNSDREQVKANQKTLTEELTSALELYSKSDPLKYFTNIAEKISEEVPPYPDECISSLQTLVDSQDNNLLICSSWAQEEEGQVDFESPIDHKRQLRAELKSRRV